MKIRFPLAGHRHHKGASRVLLMMNSPFVVYLQREPENPHDRNAVAIFMRKMDMPDEVYWAAKAEGSDVAATGWQRLGYVKREAAVALARYMDRLKVLELRGVLSPFGKMEVEADIDVDDAAKFWR